MLIWKGDFIMFNIIIASLIAVVTVKDSYLKTAADYKYTNPTQTVNTVLTGKYVDGCLFPRLENKVIFYEEFLRKYYDLPGDLGERYWPETYSTNVPLMTAWSTGNRKLEDLNFSRMLELVPRLNQSSTNSVVRKYLANSVAVDCTEGWVKHDSLFVLTNNILKIKGSPISSFPAVFKPETIALCVQAEEDLDNYLLFPKYADVMDAVYADLANATQYVRDNSSKYFSQNVNRILSEWSWFKEQEHEPEVTYAATTNSIVAGTGLGSIYYVSRTTNNDAKWGKINYGNTVSAPAIQEMDLVLDSSIGYYGDYIGFTNPHKEYTAIGVFEVDFSETYRTETITNVMQEQSQSFTTNFVCNIPLSTNIRRINGKYGDARTNAVIATVELPLNKVLSELQQLMFVNQPLDLGIETPAKLLFPVPADGSSSAHYTIEVALEWVYVISKEMWDKN